MAANVYSMVHLAREKHIPVVLLGVPRPGLFLSSAEEYRKIAESTDVLYIDDLIPDVLSEKSLKSDPVHPNAAGYRIIAENIKEKLAEAGAF
jgi:lysophospholipase L1-like esterase